MANKQDIMESLIDLKMFDEDAAKKYLEYMKNLGQHIPFEESVKFIPSDEEVFKAMEESERKAAGQHPSSKNQGRKLQAEMLLNGYEPSGKSETEPMFTRASTGEILDGSFVFPDLSNPDLEKAMEAYKQFPKEMEGFTDPIGRIFVPNDHKDRFYNPELEALAANPKADKALDAMAAEQKGLIQNQEKIKQELLKEQAKAEEKRKARHAKLARFFEDPMYQVAALDYIYKGDATGLNNILMRMANEDAQNASKEAAKSAKEEAKADETKRKEKADAEAKRKLNQEIETAKEEYRQASVSYNRASKVNSDSDEAKEAWHNLKLKELMLKHKLEDSGMDKSEIEKALNTEPPKASQTTGSTFNGENASVEIPKKPRAVAVIEADIESKMGIKDAKRKKAELKALYEELGRTSPNKTEVKARWTKLEAQLDKEIAEQEKKAGYKAEASKTAKSYDDKTKRDAAYDNLSAEAKKLVKKVFANGKYSLVLKE